MTTRNLGCIALVATLLFAPAAPAEEEEGQVEGPVYARTGFYVGAGGTSGFPTGWDSGINNDLDQEATDLANESATDNLAVIDPNAGIVPLTLTVDGADLEDVLLGANFVVGYRAGKRAAFELEVDWLVDSNKSNLDITGSAGSHTAEVEEIWTATANVRMFLPTDWRVQPSAVFGLGLQHSKLNIDLETSELMTTDKAPPGQTIDVPADFRLRRSKTKLTGAIRFGAGIDVYATPHIVGQLNVTYVLPFDQVGSTMSTDYISLVWRLVYRF